MFLKFFLSFFLLLTSFCFGQIFENNDFELWLQNALHKQIKEKWSYRLAAEFRFARGGSFLYLTYAELLFLYQPFDWLELASGYRHLGIFSPIRDELVSVYNPLWDLTIKFSTGKWNWSDRNRLQYLIPSSDVKNSWLYRNRLRLVAPWKLTQVKLVPYVENELFFRERSGFSEDRFAVGGSVEPPDTFHLRAFYMLRYIKLLERWTHQNILGIYFSFSF